MTPYKMLIHNWGVFLKKHLHFWPEYAIIPFVTADMAELADALDSGSSGFTAMEVQVLLSAPIGEFYKNSPILFQLKCLLKSESL